VDPQVAVEREVAFDIVRRGALISPLVILVCGLVRGWEGAISAAIGLVIVIVNFLAAAAIMTRAAKHGPSAIGGAALAGYIVRLGVIFGALLLLRHQPWIDMLVLGLVIVITHVGLLFWEMKYVSLSLAAPGLKPARPVTSGEK
jgi:hypothetical protein